MTASSSACFSGLVEYLSTSRTKIIVHNGPCISHALAGGKQGVQEVELKAGRPASHTEISSWEKVCYLSN